MVLGLLHFFKSALPTSIDLATVVGRAQQVAAFTRFPWTSQFIAIENVLGKICVIEPTVSSNERVAVENNEMTLFSISCADDLAGFLGGEFSFKERKRVISTLGVSDVVTG